MIFIKNTQIKLLFQKIKLVFIIKKASREGVGVFYLGFGCEIWVEVEKRMFWKIGAKKFDVSARKFNIGA